MSIFSNPAKVLANIEEAIVGESREIIAFARPTIKVLERDGRKALIAAATAAVAQAKTMDLSNGDKREAALQIIEKSLLAAGLSFIESEGRVALEMALQALKAAA
jgi:Na+/H+-dicarboxylate symporter